MTLDISATTTAILTELGARLQQYRLLQNRTVAALARQAGIGPRTVNRAEAGENVSLENVVKILRALDRLSALDAFLPPPLVSPMQLVDMKGRRRRRATGKRRG